MRDASKSIAVRFARIPIKLETACQQIIKIPDEFEYIKKAHDLETKVWGEEVSCRYGVTADARFGLVYIARISPVSSCGPDIIGAVFTFLTLDGKLFIEDLVVDPIWRGYGIGVDLLNKLSDYDLITYVDVENASSIRMCIKAGMTIGEKIWNPYHLDGGNWMYLVTKKKEN
jgi:GNAT superfamily N-acetyltransferase